MVYIKYRFDKEDKKIFDYTFDYTKKYGRANLLSTVLLLTGKEI